MGFPIRNHLCHFLLDERHRSFSGPQREVGTGFSNCSHFLDHDGYIARNMSHDAADDDDSHSRRGGQLYRAYRTGDVEEPKLRFASGLIYPVLHYVQQLAQYRRQGYRARFSKPKRLRRFKRWFSFTLLSKNGWEASSAARRNRLLASDCIVHGAGTYALSS